MADTEQQLPEEESQDEVDQEELVTEQANKEAKEEEIQQIAIEEDGEADYANLLAFEREQKVQATTALSEEGKSFGSPSVIKYFVLFFMLAVPNDAVDALELTGWLAILAWFVSFFLSMSSILISWFFDQEQKRADNYMKKVEQFQQTAIHTTRNVVRIAKFFRKSTTMKIIAGAAVEMLLFISIFPWSCLVVILAYLDERKAYKSAHEASSTIGNTSIESHEMV